MATQMNLWTHYHTPDVSLSQKPANTLRLAAWWPLHVHVDPVAVAGSAVGAYLVTGQVPWQLAGWADGVRWYAIGGVIYFAVLQVGKGDAELKYIESHMPTWLKTALGI